MLIYGIIAEYNPFHKGHSINLNAVKEASGADYIIAVMSGAACQRGRLSFIDKFSRVEMALKCGVDAVFELPAPWALQSANGFARGGVNILSGLGVNGIGFGVEENAIPIFNKLSVTEPQCVSNAIKQHLSKGLSFADSWGRAYSRYLSCPKELLNLPNLQLAYRYKVEICNLNKPVNALPVKRVGGYHDTDLGAYSAASVRENIMSGNIQGALLSVDDIIKNDLVNALSTMVNYERMDAVFMYKLRELNDSTVLKYPGAEDGLGERLINYVNKSKTLNELIESVKCKRYPLTRIERLILNAVCDIPACLSEGVPNYARLLGFRKQSQGLLTELNKRSSGFIVSDPTVLLNNPVFEAERRVTDLFGLLSNDTSLHPKGRDLTHKMVVVN